MPAPIVSWYDSTNTTQQTQWNTGVVDAGTTGPDTQFLIWNNRAGTTAVSDMTSCTMTTKDTSGGNTGDVVVERWVELRDDKVPGDVFTPIGGTTTKQVGNGVTAGVISGAVNDGTIANANANFARVTIHWRVPATATAGQRQWLTRISYNYT